MPTEKIEPRSALVIGGGIVGLCCALELLHRGAKVQLVAEQAMRGTASWGNAGHIAIEQIEPLASFAMVRSLPKRLFSRGGAVALPPRDIGAWLPFSLRLLAAARPECFARGKVALTAAQAAAMPAWRRLLARVDAPELLVEAGHYILWESERSTAQGRAHWMNSSIGTARVRDASSEELARIQTLVSPPLAGGVRFEGSGQIKDIDSLTDRLEQNFEQFGGTRRIESVSALGRQEGGRAVASLASGETIGADAIVIATGAATAPLLTPLGHRVPLIAERGYHIQSNGEDWPVDLPPVVFEDRSMIVTRFRNGLRAASFVEFGRLTSPADPRKWERLHAHAGALGLPIGEDARSWMGARPTLPDYLPAIGRSPHVSNLFYAFGHQHLGLTLGPITGEAIGALVFGDRPPLDLTPFDLQRF